MENHTACGLSSAFLLLSTFAWFTATQSATINTLTAATGSLSSAVDAITTVQDFEIKVVHDQGNSAKTVSLTDGDGACWVYNGTGGPLVPATAANATEIAYTVTLTVEYLGTEAMSAAQTKVLFATALGSNVIKVTAAATGTNSDRVRFDTTSGSYDNAGEKVVTFANNTAKGWAFDQSGTQGANHKTASIDVDVWYVSINGADSGTPDSSISAGVSFTPTVSAS